MAFCRSHMVGTVPLRTHLPAFVVAGKEVARKQAHQVQKYRHASPLTSGAGVAPCFVVPPGELSYKPNNIFLFQVIHGNV